EPRGLVNTGNICFANVVLQALVHSGAFYVLFRDLAVVVPGNIGRRGLLRVQAWNEDPFVPEFLYDAMKENKRFDSMQRGHQEDAEEFLGFFLDTLHEELLALLSKHTPSSALADTAGTNTSEGGGEDEREDAWLEVGKKNKVTVTRTTKARESAITRIFGGKLRSVLRTPGAKDSVTLEPYQSLQLDIQPDYVRTVEDALLHLTQSETVQVHSASRGGAVDATKQVFVESLPPILVLHMKRFIYDAVGGVQKSQKIVSYGTTLEIKPEVLSPAQRSGKPVRYKLYGVVYHHGKFATGGHYTIDVLRQDHSEWIRIDDTHIAPVTESEVAEPKKNDKVAYLLFYQRVEDGGEPQAPVTKPISTAQPHQQQQMSGGAKPPPRVQPQRPVR
ncbi:hypothetical protein BOTBODRAFT_107096, partial [Botryobasidium botryosum FD-172 SS1]